MLDRTKDVIVIEVDQGLKFPGNDHLKQTILDEALEGRFILICHNINITDTSTNWERINKLSIVYVFCQTVSDESKVYDGLTKCM